MKAYENFIEVAPQRPIAVRRVQAGHVQFPPFDALPQLAGAYPSVVIRFMRCDATCGVWKPHWPYNCVIRLNGQANTPYHLTTPMPLLPSPFCE